MKISKLALVLIFAVGINISIAILYYVKMGSGKIELHIAKAFFLIVFSVMTYHQIRWAKWILIGWFVFNSITGFGNVNSFKSQEDLVLIGLSTIYIIISLLILFVPNKSNSR